MSSIFSPDIYANRIASVQRLCAEQHLDGIIIPPGAQLAYLTGSWISTHERFSALVIPTHGTPSFFLPAVDRGDLAKSAIPALDITVRGWEDGDQPHALAVAALDATDTSVIGIGSDLTADHLLPIQQLLGAGTTTVLATSVLAELFIRKDEAEIEQLAQAGAAIDRVHAQVPALLRPGRTEAEVAADISELILTEHSAVDFVIVGSGPNGANPHHDFSNRVLATGDVVVVDIGGTYGVGYHSDCTRTYVVGGPSALEDPAVTAFYDVLYQAQEQACQAVRPGMTASQIDSVARDIITAAGYGEYFIHRTGHGIGLSTHEEPFIMQGNDLVLEPGMAFSVEPGIYIPGASGARIEDIVVVTADGCRRLNQQPRVLQ
ncbi:Xaa-Pro peptidase family protein [Corynebacterium sp. HS2168-gen11]|uniref:M24 family metallopeptidase n=1 Tax=Corynebacterium sp. HS2168-gen11 TaxID=2974027 RepID=UPI00216AEF15|nr:Xaa-Pro peptidase family protein [Corynebacterium sp. HS2168-gen11]MCS4535073.1 Xaa-Pro peptidase family protein [Corynebacterium sp. HS2168-gen11]